MHSAWRELGPWTEGLNGFIDGVQFHLRKRTLEQGSPTFTRT